MQERIKELVVATGLETKHLELVDDSWIVENPNGELVGYAGIERRGGRVYLQSMVVKNGYRKLGIGRKLVEKAYESIAEGDILIALTFFWNNNFYRKCGFEQLDAKETKQTDDIGMREKHKCCTAWGKIK